MAKGEMSFDASKRQVKKFVNTPLTPGEYDFKFRSGKAAITVADGVGKVPYINGCQFELMDSASTEGGKNRLIYKSFFLRVSPDADGVAAVDRGDGLVAFSKAIGVNLKLGEGSIVKKAAKDKKGKDVTVLMLDPKKVVAWLKEQDGSKGSLRAKNRKDQNDPDVKWPDVDYFIEAEGMADEDEELEDETEESEESEDEIDEEDEEDEESDEDEDEDEDEAPKKGKKAAPGKKGKK